METGLIKLATAKQVKYECVLTSFNDEFIELDNKLIIFKKYIFSIELK